MAASVRSPGVLFEVKHDALAIVKGHHCRLVSGRSHVYSLVGLRVATGRQDIGEHHRDEA
jgi:hypothetical protein